MNEFNLFNSVNIRIHIHSEINDQPLLTFLLLKYTAANALL